MYVNFPSGWWPGKIHANVSLNILTRRGECWRDSLYTEPRPWDEEAGFVQLRRSYYLTVTSCYLLLVQPQIISRRPSPLSLRKMQKMPGGGTIVLKSTYLNALFGWKHLLRHHNWPFPYVFLFAGWNVRRLLNVRDAKPRSVHNKQLRDHTWR